MKHNQQDNSEFAKMHPAINFLYLAGVLIITMSTLNPWMLGISFVVSLWYGLMQTGWSMLKKNVIVEVPIIIFTVLIQPLFSHTGTTVLFYINDNAITAQAYVYGAAICVLLLAIIQWCSCLHVLISSDKMMYLFGKTVPSVGLMISMIVRYVPLLRERYAQIHEGQAGLGRTIKKEGLPIRGRQYLKEISILIAWSLEASIETSASMEARGYGLKGRTNYFLYKWQKRDIITGIYLIIFLTIALIGVFSGSVTVYYLPAIYFEEVSPYSIVTGVAFAMFAIFPLVCDIRGVLKWNYLNSKM